MAGMAMSQASEACAVHVDGGIAAQVRLSDNLLETGLPSSDIMSLMLLRSQVSRDASTEFAVALTDSKRVCWINNLEADTAYNKWDNNLQALLYRQMPGRWNMLWHHQ
jgi:hypothetical protein